MALNTAVNMAALLKLHRESTYVLPENPTADQIVQSESARRIFWMVHGHASLHTGYKAITVWPRKVITTLLPCGDEDFALGKIPDERGALPGTPPADVNRPLVCLPSAGLLASLIQVQHLWGQVAGRVRRADRAVNQYFPWHESSDFQKMLRQLRWRELYLPGNHRFSWEVLGRRKSESVHLSYLNVTMLLRLSNIVERCKYLPDTLAMFTTEPTEQFEPLIPTMANANDKPDPDSPTPTPHHTAAAAPPGFWIQVTDMLYLNVWVLYEQINTYYYSFRTNDKAVPQILVFCVYITGCLAAYLRKYPMFCPPLSFRAEEMAQRCLEVLGALQDTWPMCSDWLKDLGKRVPGPGIPMEEPDMTERAGQALEDATLLATQNQFRPDDGKGPRWSLRVPDDPVQAQSGGMLANPPSTWLKRGTEKPDIVLV